MVCPKSMSHAHTRTCTYNTWIHIHTLITLHDKSFQGDHRQPCHLLTLSSPRYRAHPLMTLSGPPFYFRRIGTGLQYPHFSLRPTRRPKVFLDVNSPEPLTGLYRLPSPVTKSTEVLLVDRVRGILPPKGS